MKLLISMALIGSILQAKHLHKEAYYQTIVCKKMNGVKEYTLYDNTV
jgi:hypothetical protein